MLPQNKPSMKIMALSIICGALILSIGIYRLLPHASTSDAILTTAPLGLTLSVDTKEDLTDSDRDGLKDWEEVLWGSDIDQSDTDKDGTDDGTETKVNRNPTIPAPNDTILTAEARASSSASLNENVVNNSLTDKISKNLFGLLLQAKDQNKSALTSAELEQIASSVNGDLETSTSAHYSSAAVTTFPDNDTEQGKNYGESFGRMYLDMLIYISSQKTLNSREIGTEYQALSRDLSLLTVPSSLHQTHINLINNMYAFGATLITLENADNDPVKAMLAIRDYRKLSGEQETLFTTVSNYFKRNGILFDDKEVKALWENI
jgi:hypothetical protein